MNVRLASEIQTDSIVDGEGIRAVIWFQGCSHKCPGCHNPHTHDFQGGIEYKVEDICKQISELEFHRGITLSGGDPFFQCKAAARIAKFAHDNGLNVWAYTGFLYEELIQNEQQKELLENIDVLIDGKFDLNQKSFNCKFRGSKNQRIIDVPKSLEEKEVILYYED